MNISTRWIFDGNDSKRISDITFSRSMEEFDLINELKIKVISRLIDDEYRAEQMHDSLTRINNTTSWVNRNFNS